jgi:drug/metabolite transporter (DMT)-like permease
VLAALPFVKDIAWGDLGAPVWGAIAYSTGVSSVVAFFLWSRSVQAMGGSRTALYNCVIPVVAGLVAWMVLDERPLPLQGLGAALVIGGVLVSRVRGAMVEE